MYSVTIDPARCDRSPGCPARMACPEGAIVRESGEGPWTIDQSRCVGCGACVYSCPMRAVEMQGQVN